MAEAESLYQRALDGYTRNLQAKPRSRVDLLYNMGLFYRKLRDSETAKEFFRQAHEGCQSQLGSQHADTVGALEELNQSIKYLAPPSRTRTT